MRPPLNMSAKRVQIVSLKVIREGSVTYAAQKITSPVDTVALVRGFLEDADREKLLAVFLNSQNEPNAIHLICIGTLSSAQVHPREVFKAALLSNAAAIILAHNHPSGNPSPSREDIELTKRLRKCGDLLGVSVLDHVIIGSNGRYVSLLQNGLIK